MRPTNHDHAAHAPYVDVAYDLEEIPWPWADEEFAAVIATDVMEHLRAEVRDWLGECWRILAPEGTLTLQVPHWGTRNAYANPTHRRAFDVKTFDFWCPGRSWYHAYGSHDSALAADGRLWEIQAASRSGDNCIFELRKLK